jgi:hypothetical protein
MNIPCRLTPTKVILAGDRTLIDAIWQMLIYSTARNRTSSGDLMCKRINILPGIESWSALFEKLVPIWLLGIDSWRSLHCPWHLTRQKTLLMNVDLRDLLRFHFVNLTDTTSLKHRIIFAKRSLMAKSLIENEHCLDECLLMRHGRAAWLTSQNHEWYRLVDKYMHQPRLMKLNITNIDKIYLSSDVVSIALASWCRG